MSMANYVKAYEISEEEAVALAEYSSMDLGMLEGVIVH
mgnify:CR=1 FL=1